MNTSKHQFIWEWNDGRNQNFLSFIKYFYNESNTSEITPLILVSIHKVLGSSCLFFYLQHSCYLAALLLNQNV